MRQSERDTLVVRGYLSEEERDNGAAIKKAIEGVISDLVFELLSETAKQMRAKAKSEGAERVTRFTQRPW